MRRLAIRAVLLVLAVGCAGQPVLTGSPPPTTPEEPLARPTEPSGEGPFRCDLPFASIGGAGPNHVTGIRITPLEGYDRLTFTFDHGSPTLELRQGRPPFTSDPAGEPLPVEGNVFLLLTMHGASRGGMDGPLTYAGPTSFSPRSAVLTQMRMAGDFEATMSFVLGLAGPPCHRVFALEGPRRLVIDLRLR